jgi:hypothetical protein
MLLSAVSFRPRKKYFKQQFYKNALSRLEDEFKNLYFVQKRI